MSLWHSVPTAEPTEIGCITCDTTTADLPCASHDRFSKNPLQRGMHLHDGDFVRLHTLRAWIWAQVDCALGPRYPISTS
jgi:hypothetical protein